MDPYYDDNYFHYQKKEGMFAAKAMHHFFEKFVKSTDRVLDFGCGGGYLLHALEAKEKIGIEINPSARQAASTLGIITVSSISEVENNWADVVISSHALEHTRYPFDILVDLGKKVRNEGLVVFIVPHETKYKYDSNDINKHLYTWSEMNIGNLFKEAGFKVIEVKEIIHRFPRNKEFILTTFGKKIFNSICFFYGLWIRYRHMTQVRVIASKTVSSF